MTFVYNQEAPINYQVEGDGPPLVLHHGFSQSLEVWYDNGYVDALKQGYQLILIDSRGHGASDKLYTPEAYSLEARATDVVAVLDALGVGQTHYFGYSLGGWVGFGLAKYAPERVHSLTIGGAQPYGQSMAPYRTILQEGLESGLAQLETAAGISLPEAAQQRFLQNDARALLAAYTNDRPDISEILPAMTMPCLLFAGEADPLQPAIERCAAELSNATFVAWPGLNHIQMGLQLKTMLSHLTQFLTTVSVQNTKQIEKTV
jgi:pimeloyl-ACP methyl ester carboxylesterase